MLVAMVAFFAAAGVARAGAVTVPDGDDVAGPLDIRSVSHGHTGAKLTHTIRTYAGWRLALLGPKTPNYFLLELSTRGGPAPERSILVFARKGRLVALVFGPGPKRRYIGAASVKRPNRHMIRITLTRKQIGSPAGYKWQAFSYFKSKTTCRRGCFDPGPRVLHDIRAPKIVFPQPAPPAGSTDYNLDFTVTDPGGATLASGVDRWELQHRNAPGESWTDVLVQGNDAGPQSFHFFADALGDSDQFRVVAWDAQNNRRVSPVRTVLTTP